MDAGSKIIYRGYSYSRSPGRLYYFPSSWVKARYGRESLHRDIYTDTYGPIPAGYHVHHKDGNAENNTPENFELISASDHAKHHYEDRFESIKAARQAWERTPEAKATKRAAMAKARANTPERTESCPHCGKPVATRHSTRIYCSSACQAADRRLVKNLRECPICGSTYGGQAPGARNVAQTCSYKCGWELRRRNGLRANG